MTTHGDGTRVVRAGLPEAEQGAPFLPGPVFAGPFHLEGEVDTAGRLHTQQHLMDELRKVRNVIARQAPGAPHETLLTIDATTGQNGLRQALLFREAVDVTGIALTKLDGTAKGGIALAIAQELGVPVKLIGIGETLEDLRPFDPDDFARAILEP